MSEIEGENEKVYRRKWETTEYEEKLRVAVRESGNLRNVCNKLGLVPSGANYTTVKKHIARLDLDVSHHASKEWRPRHKHEGNIVDNSKLKRIMVEERGHQCEQCGGCEWNGQKILLTVEHTDGNIFNDSLDNLLLLCRNCHAQTKAWCWRKSVFDPDDVKERREKEARKRDIESRKRSCARKAERAAKTQYCSSPAYFVC